METNDEDDISLNSTEVEGFEEDQLFEVERILAEHLQPDGIELYLVKWEGYSLADSTWQGSELFSTSESLEDWQKHKLQVAQGLAEAFDVEDFYHAVEERDAKKAERKLRRHEKRIALGLPVTNVYDEDMSLPEGKRSHDDNSNLSQTTGIEEDDAVRPSKKRRLTGGMDFAASSHSASSILSPDYQDDSPFQPHVASLADSQGAAPLVSADDAAENVTSALRQSPSPPVDFLDTEADASSIDSLFEEREDQSIGRQSSSLSKPSVSIPSRAESLEDETFSNENTVSNAITHSTSEVIADARDCIPASESGSTTDPVAEMHKEPEAQPSISTGRPGHPATSNGPPQSHTSTTSTNQATINALPTGRVFKLPGKSLKHKYRNSTAVLHPVLSQQSEG
jgi:hypothetical protein